MAVRQKSRNRPKSYQDSCEKLAWKRRTKIYARRFYRIGFIFAVLFITSVSIWLLNNDTPKTYTDFVAERFFNLTASTGLRFETVKFEGNKYSGEAELAKALGLSDDKIGSPILGFDLQQLRQKVKQEGWVKDAQVQRILPSNIKITITERKPIAIWQHGKKYYLIDSDGVNLTEVDSPDVLPFPLIIGDGANKEAARVFAVLGHEKKLYQQVQSAALMGERRWNVLFTNGIEVLLPADDLSGAWSRLAAMEQQEHILERQIKSIDLRLKDRIYIKTLEGDVVKNSLRSKNV
jgi:cell division protein FtsQ